MKLIKPHVEIVNPTGYTLDDIYKMIELVGRVCYKSENKITEGSAKKFVDMMIKSGHGAMLEHGTIYLKFITAKGAKNPLDKYYINRYSEARTEEGPTSDTKIVYVTTNMRVLVENDWMDDLQYLCEPTEYHTKRITAKFTCDRITSQSIVRHRLASFAQESTRYCNYSKDKFDNELTFAIPTWVDLKEGNYELTLSIEKEDEGDWWDYKKNDNGSTELIRLKPFKNDTVDNWLMLIKDCESTYLRLIKDGWQAQQARMVLPMSVKTEINMTADIPEWRHFFELRCDKAAHPDVRALANNLLIQMRFAYPKEFDDLYFKYIHDGE